MHVECGASLPNKTIPLNQKKSHLELNNTKPPMKDLGPRFYLEIWKMRGEFSQLNQGYSYYNMKIDESNKNR